MPEIERGTKSHMVDKFEYRNPQPLHSIEANGLAKQELSLPVIDMEFE